METSSDSDTTEEWVVLDGDIDDNDYLLKDQASFEDDVSGCVDFPDACGISEERTTSLGFTEEGNPPDNGEIPPAEDLEVNDHHDQNVQNFDEPAEDLSDMSSYTKDELPEDVDMTPAVRHYIHKKNANLNSLLNIYLVLAVIAASALGLGNFLGWSYCSSLKSVLHKQEQMLEQLQNKLNDCNSYLNASNLFSSDSVHSKYSRPAKEIEHQARNSEHIAYQEEKNWKKAGEHWDNKNLRNLIHYPLSALESRSDSSSYMGSVDKHGQAGVLSHVLYFENVKPNVVNVKNGAEQSVDSPQRKGSITEFATHKPIDTLVPDLGFGKIGLDTESFKETLSAASPLSDQRKDPPLNLKFHDLYMGKHFSDMVLDMSYFNIAFPQKKGLESQENFHSGSFLAVDNLESSKIQNFDIKNGQPNSEDSEVKYNPSTQDDDSNYHTASLISSMNNVLSLQQMRNIREDYLKSNLNVTQAVFQELLENLREKLEDIKNFTLLPLFVKHSHYSQKAVKKLFKVFDIFMGRMLKYRDMFLQKNIHRDNKVDKLTGKLLSCMNKLNCKWQKIKDKWQHLIQHEQQSFKNVNFKENRCHSGDCSQKKYESHTYKYNREKPECLMKNGRKREQMKDKSDYQIVIEHQKTVECLRNVYFGEEAKKQVKSDYQRAVEQLLKEEFFGRRKKDNKLSSVLGEWRQLLKESIIEVLRNEVMMIPRQVESKSSFCRLLKHLRNVYFSEQEKEQMKGKLNYLRILKLLRSMYFGDMAVEQGIDTANYFRTVECFIKSGLKADEFGEDRSDYQKILKTIEHFRNGNLGDKAEQKDKSDGKGPTYHISKDEFHELKTKAKREYKWENVHHHMKDEFYGRKAKEQEKDNSDVQGIVKLLIKMLSAEKQLKVTPDHKKHLEYLVKDKTFGGKTKEKVKNKPIYREENYKGKSVFEQKLKNGKSYGENNDKENKKGKHSISDLKKSGNNFKYKEYSRRDFMNSRKVPDKRNKFDHWGKS